MMTYIRLPGLFALHVECCREMSAEPLFSRNSCNGETIFDMPYCRVVWTPEWRLRNKKVEDTHGPTTHKIPVAAAGTAEDRP